MKTDKGLEQLKREETEVSFEVQDTEDRLSKVEQSKDGISIEGWAVCYYRTA